MGVRGQTQKIKGSLCSLLCDVKKIYLQGVSLSVCVWLNLDTKTVLLSLC